MEKLTLKAYKEVFNSEVGTRREFKNCTLEVMPSQEWTIVIRVTFPSGMAMNQVSHMTELRKGYTRLSAALKIA